MPGAGDDPLIGQTLDSRYRVRRLLGRGGMGAVYEADHVGLDRRVAVKLITSTEIDPQALVRFRREARIAGKIVDPHVVQIFDVGTDASGRDFIAMEYVEGRDLNAVIGDGPLDPARAVAIATQLLGGLAAIHEAGIIHRDIKPGNVLLTELDGVRDVVKLMDFGISKSLGERGEALTGTGNVIGTPEYMAPEQLAGEDVDHRADLYAVGLVLFEMLAGERPFSAGSFSELAAMQLRDEPPPLDEIRDDLPPHVVAAVARALAKRPADRFRNAGAFADALAGRAPVTQPTGAATRVDRPSAVKVRPTPRPRWHWGAAILAIAAGVTIALAFRLRGHDGIPPPADAAVAKVDPLAAARDVEATNPELAIARYVEINEARPDPKLLFRIAELHERLDHIPEAVRYFKRYLGASPGTDDRTAVTARIARLSPPPPVDAGVPDAPRPPAHPIATAPAKKCHCLPASKVYDVYVCHTRVATPLCRCRAVRSSNDWLCPSRFEKCPDGKCPNGRVGFTVNGAPFSCSDPDFFLPHLHLKEGDACEGYSSSGITSDPETARATPLFAGAQHCDGCALAPIMSREQRRKQFQYLGQPGDACKGYPSSLDRPIDGHLVCDDEAP